MPINVIIKLTHLPVKSIYLADNVRCSTLTTISEATMKQGSEDKNSFTYGRNSIPLSQLASQYLPMTFVTLFLWYVINVDAPSHRDPIHSTSNPLNGSPRLTLGRSFKRYCSEHTGHKCLFFLLAEYQRNGINACGNKQALQFDMIMLLQMENLQFRVFIVS